MQFGWHNNHLKNYSLHWLTLYILVLNRGMYPGFASAIERGYFLLYSAILFDDVLEVELAEGCTISIIHKDIERKNLASNCAET